MPRRLTRALNYSVLDGLLHAAMVGLGESYLGALAVELGHGPTALAILTSVPLLVGALSQLLSAPLARLFGSRKRFVVTGAVLQGLMMIAFVAIAWADERSLLALLIAKCVFWISGTAIGPAWGAWMGTLTRAAPRQRYFALRSGLINVVLLVAFVGAGLSLAAGGDARPLDTYGWLFAAALVARIGSAVALGLQADVRPLGFSGRRPPSSLARIREALRSSEWRVPLYLAALMLGAHTAVPFFTPYMLRDLGLDYREFALLTAFSISAKAVAFPLVDRIAARFGLRTVLLGAGVGIAIIPLPWALSPNVAVLAAAQVVSGAAWAGLEFASFQLLLQGTKSSARIEFLSLSASLSGVAQVIGGVMGGRLIERAGLDYQDVFSISAVGRGLALLLLVVTLPKLVWPARLLRLPMRLVSVRPAGGTVERPLVADED